MAVDLTDSSSSREHWNQASSRAPEDQAEKIPSSLKATAGAAATATISGFYRWLVGAASTSDRQQAAQEPAANLPGGDRKVGHDAQSGACPDSKRPGQLKLAGNSIGYKLLQQAGWQEGSGLGAQQQGRLQPISAWHQHGRSGIGRAPANAEARPRRGLAPGTCTHRCQPQQQASLPDQGRQSLGMNAESPGCSSQAQPACAKAPKRKWGAVKVEESTEVKVRRVRQALLAEQDHEQGKAIQKLLYRAMREPDSGDTGLQDHSPLLRSQHRLRRRNPLL